MVVQAVATARAAGGTGHILVRGDSAYGDGVVLAACRRSGARFSLVLTKNRAIATIDDGAWTPVHYPEAVRDPDTSEWISDAQVAEVSYTAFASASHAVTARLIVRRANDARYRDALFPVWRYHPLFTDRRGHRRRRYHQPPPRRHRNRVLRPHRRTPGAHALRTLRGQLGLDLVRGHRPQPAACSRRARQRCLRGGPRGDTRRKIITVPARLARPQRRPVLHLPSRWPWSHHWLKLWRNIIDYSPPIAVNT
jgi:hypothetical protein